MKILTKKKQNELINMIARLHSIFFNDDILEHMVDEEVIEVVDIISDLAIEVNGVDGLLKIDDELEKYIAHYGVVDGE